MILKLQKVNQPKTDTCFVYDKKNMAQRYVFSTAEGVNEGVIRENGVCFERRRVKTADREFHRFYQRLLTSSRLVKGDSVYLGSSECEGESTDEDGHFSHQVRDPRLHRRKCMEVLTYYYLIKICSDINSRASFICSNSMC